MSGPNLAETTHPPRKLHTSAKIESFRCEQGWGAWHAKDSEMKKFVEFWDYLNRNHLEFSGLWVGYYMKALSDGYIDGLINLTIAMENILLPNTHTELRYKFALRPALILKKEFEIRKNIKKIFRDIYDERSKIVHGEKGEIKEFDFLLYLHFCRKILCLYTENKSIWNEALSEIELGQNRLSYNLANLSLDLRYILDKREQSETIPNSESPIE